MPYLEDCKALRCKHNMNKKSGICELETVAINTYGSCTEFVLIKE